MSWEQLSNETSVGIESRISTSTLRIYKSCLRTYERTMKKMKIEFGESVPDPYPFTEEKIRNSLEYYRRQNPGTTFGYIKSLLAAISFELRRTNQVNITLSPSVQNYIISLERKMTKSSKNSKLGFNQMIMMKFAQIDASIFENLRFISMACVSFYGFLRVSECCSLKKQDVKFDDNGVLLLTIAKSKTDQTGEGITIYIHESNTSFSAVKWMKMYLENGVNKVEGQMLFGISSRGFRMKLKEILRNLQIDTDKYSTHSFRKGAAECAAKLGIQDCRIKAMGRWMSDVYQRYTAVTMADAGQAITPKI